MKKQLPRTVSHQTEIANNITWFHITTSIFFAKSSMHHLTLEEIGAITDLIVTEVFMLYIFAQTKF